MELRSENYPSLEIRIFGQLFEETDDLQSGAKGKLASFSPFLEDS